MNDALIIQTAADYLRDGRLVVIPTETVYGLGANALDEKAVSDIFTAKGRPQDNPLIVHVTTLEDAEKLTIGLTDTARRLAERFWPGPMTLILPKSRLVPEVVSAGLDTVAVRMPSHPVARAVIRQSGVPVAAPSANLSGSPSPTSAEHCIADLDGRVDMIIDGGPCQVGVESTVLSLSGEHPVILRPGAVTKEMLESVIGDVRLHQAVTASLGEEAAAVSPGMKYRHYAPDTKLTLVHGSLDVFLEYAKSSRCRAVMVFDEDIPLLPSYFSAVAYGRGGNPESQAKRLFAALRELDELHMPCALVRAPALAGTGLAVYNRLLRACGFHEIDRKNKS